MRFRELERRLHPITQATLTRALRQMEDDGLVHREVYGTIPPKVEYSLTEVGAGFKTVLASLEQWGNQLYRLHESRWPHLRNASGISCFPFNLNSYSLLYPNSTRALCRRTCSLKIDFCR